MEELRNVLIIGDSYSTFAGYIPEGYGPYYSEVSSEATDVNRVEQTWWHQVIQQTKANLVSNHSWSGTTICNTGYDGPNIPHSFIRRFDKLVKEGFFQENPIDTVFVMGGQNDDWCNAPIGGLKTQDWADEDLLQYGPAVCYLMHRLKTVLPNARVIFLINCDMKERIMDYQEQAAKIYSIEYIRLQEIHKMNGHPTIQGMRQIAEQVLRYLECRK